MGPSEGFCEVIMEDTPQTSAASPAEPEAKERDEAKGEPAPEGDVGYEYEEADVLEEELPLDEVQVNERLRKEEGREKGTP